MKTLEQTQEENRKAIIMACNPRAKSYEEALEMEVGMGCIIKTHLQSRGYAMPEYTELPIINDHNRYNDKFVLEPVYIKTIRVISENKKSNSQDVIIGKPLTLSRVLIALEPYPNNYGVVAGNIARFNRKTMSYDFLCKWGLTKETIEEQSEETQRAINKLLIECE